MALGKNGQRVVAAAFALGLSLAGPQALGVAGAEAGDGDNASAPAPADQSARAEPKSGAEATARAGRAAVAPRNRPVGVVRNPAVVAPGSAAAAGTSEPAEPPGRAARRTWTSNSPSLSDARPPDSAATVAAPAPVPLGPARAAVDVAGVVAGPAPSVAATLGAPAAMQAAALAPPQAGGQRTWRGAAPRTAMSTSTPVDLNTAVVGLFDAVADWLSVFPANPVSEFLSGSLLLLRRSLFDQLPFYDLTTTALPEGQLTGNIARDPEGDALTYTVVQAPVLGTVTFDPDGAYTYTPGSDFRGNDSFVVSVTDPGFNLLAPAANRSVTFAVPLQILQATNPIGAVLKPGEHIDFNIDGYNYHVYNTTGGAVRVTHYWERAFPVADWNSKLGDWSFNTGANTPYLRQGIILNRKWSYEYGGTGQVIFESLDPVQDSTPSTPSKAAVEAFRAINTKYVWQPDYEVTPTPIPAGKWVVRLGTDNYWVATPEAIFNADGTRGLRYGAYPDSRSSYDWLESSYSYGLYDVGCDVGRCASTGINTYDPTVLLLDGEGAKYPVRIEDNPRFSYGDAMQASTFSYLAYNHRDNARFISQIEATGWQGIQVSTGTQTNDFSPSAGGYGVNDPSTYGVKSYAFAGTRTAADETVQFVFAVEGSNSPFDEPGDWVANAGKYGWSSYYASVQPLMTEVVRQMLQAQGEGKNTQLILTGHSLGGAVAMMAFADLLAPEGNLWPDTTDYLADGHRLFDAVGNWTAETRKAILDSTSVYTFGAPSPLVEPTKLTNAGAIGVVTAMLAGPLISVPAVLLAAVGAITADDRKLPEVLRVPFVSDIPGINFTSQVFQFEHANTSSLPPYPGDVVAQIGRDAGTVLQINLHNSVQRAYAGDAGAFVPGITHPMSLYRESVIRLVVTPALDPLLKDPNVLALTTPKLPQTGRGQGSDARNDSFLDVSDEGKDGNDLFTFFYGPGSYTASGGEGDDIYSVIGLGGGVTGGGGIKLTIDGANQAGRDTLLITTLETLFGKPSTSNVEYDSAANAATFTITSDFKPTAGQSSSVTVLRWDLWQLTDVFLVQLDPSEPGRVYLNRWDTRDIGNSSLNASIAV